MNKNIKNIIVLYLLPNRNKSKANKIIRLMNYYILLKILEDNLDYIIYLREYNYFNNR